MENKYKVNYKRLGRGKVARFSSLTEAREFVKSALKDKEITNISLWKALTLSVNKK